MEVFVSIFEPEFGEYVDSVDVLFRLDGDDVVFLGLFFVDFLAVNFSDWLKAAHAVVEKI